MSAFAALGLSPGLLRAAGELGWTAPTPIQAAAIPPALAGRDVLATAATGSGKTGAYAFAALQRIDDIARLTPRRPRVLLLVPTRELAAQVFETLRQVEGFLSVPAKVVALYGGVSINPQLMALRGGADVIVATPGRLLDVVDKNALDLSGLHTLVLDEADRLLDGGFADELARVLALLPARRQNLLFSATFPSAVEALAQRLLHEPVRVDVGDQAARFELARPDSHGHDVAHPHFLCDACGDVLCLDGVRVVIPKAAGARRTTKSAPRGIGTVTDITLRGRCSKCG